MSRLLERDNNLDVIDRKEPTLSIQSALKPIFIDLASQHNDVILLKAQFTIVFYEKRIEYNKM